MKYEVLIDGHSHQVELERADNGYQCLVDGEPFSLDVAMTARDVLSIIHEGRNYEAKREYSLMGDTHIIIGSERFAAEVRDPRSLRSRRAAAGPEAGPAENHRPYARKNRSRCRRRRRCSRSRSGTRRRRSHEDAKRNKGHQKRQSHKIAVKEGSAVNAGDLLASSNSRPTFRPFACSSS